jgi:hypothetical protein
MRRLILLLTVLAIASIDGSWATGQDTLEVRAAALLLRNGEVLEGRISFEGDYCAVLMERGEIRIRREQIAGIESSLEAVYLNHISPKAPAGVQGHTERADWCLRHNLLGYAASEITLAMRLAPKSQRVVALAQRLEAARRPPSTKAKPRKVAHRLPSAQQHVAAVHGKSLETFTVAVQPLLLNRCANSTCHGRASKNEFRLDRGYEGRPITRSQTLANLNATLRFVDRKSPATSQLLTTPIRPHAKAKQAVFLQQHRKQYEVLARWVERLGPEPRTAQDSAVASDNKSAKKIISQQQPVGINPTIDTLARPLNDADRKTSSAPAVRKAVEAKQTQATDGRDPFDPEEFNRLYHKKRYSKSSQAGR